MRRKIYFLLMLPLTILSCNPGRPEASLVQPAGKGISPDISNQKITSFAEDAQGHIWIGTGRGVNKYDAYEFYQYFFDSNDSLSLCDNNIRQVFRDSRHRLWIGTANGICCYTDEDRFQRIPNESISQNVMQIMEDSEGRIFLNMVVQLCEYRPEENRFVVVIPDFDTERMWTNRCFTDRSGQLWSVSGTTVRCYATGSMELKMTVPLQGFVHYAFLRDNGELWLASGSTLSIYDTRNRCFTGLPESLRKHPALAAAIVHSIHPYSPSSLLFNTSGGLYLYDFLEHTVTHQSENGFPFQSPDGRISALFTDSQKNLWIGSADQGYVTRYSYKERFNNNNYLLSQIGRKSVTSLRVDGEGNLWIATSTGEVFVYSPSTKAVRPVDTRQFFLEEQKFRQDRVSRIFIDRSNALWLISEMDKIIQCRYDGRLRPEKVFRLPTPKIFCMAQGHDGTIYAAGFNENLYTLRKGDTEFRAEPLYPPTYVFTPGLLALSSGKVLAASFKQDLQLLDPTSGRAQTISMRKHIRQSEFIPIALYEDSAGNIWVGTLANGLFRYSPAGGEMQPMPGAACTDISAMEEDAQGNLWVSTLYGLSKYDRATGKFTNYYANDGIGGNQFNERSACRLADGTLVFGGTHGLTCFNPADVTRKQTIPLLFETLRVHNRLISPSPQGCIDRNLSLNPDIRLKHGQNSFTISFAALDYCEYERVRYYYRMEGFDKGWIDANHRHDAYYSNLPPGRYTFRVKIMNNDETVVEAENAITVIVTPAPWRSGWAYALYTLLAAGLAGAFVKTWRRIRTSRDAAIQARREQEQEQRINKMNMHFFANVSHEFRTPLTMILGPINQLCNDAGITGEHKHLLYITQRSVNRMLELVNQLLDFNKLENDALKLSVQPTDIIAVLARQTEIFRLNARQRNITLLTQGLEDRFTMWLDRDKLEKILGNLLINALKFTKDGGQIALAFDVINRENAAELFPPAGKSPATEYVKIAVSDTGCGIPKDKLEKVFERYFQVENQQPSGYNWGTGIGLYYARRLAELHHGRIKAANRPEGGAVFTFILPAGDEAYSAEERERIAGRQEDAFPLLTDEQYRLPAQKPPAKEPCKLLLVDDDTEVLHYLQTFLSPYYQIITAFNAHSAFKTLKEQLPDLVLSDVVMPGDSGYELCRMIKEDLQSCHIPVILLTAKATLENQVEGFDTGADAYVTKPFDPAYLLALIKSQLKNREHVRSLLARTTKADKIEKDILSPQDNAFMTSLYRLMETELSNTELNISRMTEVLKMSRTKFYYKVKGLTGENPNVFFKTYKLNRAAELLSEGKYRISEVADLCGFGTLSHFSSSFKKLFGRAPNEWRGEG
jgi:signal transduction histidine kinase/ligand-binding sensor domain-containing protein/DNA-binding response OmpR family regulator